MSCAFDTLFWSSFHVAEYDLQSHHGATRSRQERPCEFGDTAALVRYGCDPECRGDEGTFGAGWRPRVDSRRERPVGVAQERGRGGVCRMSWFNQIAEVGYIFSCSRPLLSGFIACNEQFICALRRGVFP